MKGQDPTSGLPMGETDDEGGAELVDASGGGLWMETEAGG